MVRWSYVSVCHLYSAVISATGLAIEDIVKLYVVMCSSEANDLALRLARAHTHAQDAIVLDQYVLRLLLIIYLLNFGHVRHESAFVQFIALHITDCTLVHVHFLYGMWCIVLNGSTVPLMI